MRAESPIDIPSQDGPTEVPVIVEDLLCQIELLNAGGADSAVVADIWTQVKFPQAR